MGEDKGALIRTKVKRI